MSGVFGDGRYSELVKKHGEKQLKAKINKLIKEGRAKTRMKAISVLWQEEMWDSKELDMGKAFWLGQYARSNLNRAMVLTKRGVFDVECSIDTANPLLSTVKLGEVAVKTSRTTGMTRVVLAEDPKRMVKKGILKPSRLLEWGLHFGEMDYDRFTPVAFVAVIQAIGPIMPDEAWMVTADGGRKLKDNFPMPKMVQDDDTVGIRLVLNQQNVYDGSKGIATIKITQLSTLIDLMAPYDMEGGDVLKDLRDLSAEEQNEELQALRHKVIVGAGRANKSVLRDGSRIKLNNPYIVLNPGFVLDGEKAMDAVKGGYIADDVHVSKEVDDDEIAQELLSKLPVDAKKLQKLVKKHKRQPLFDALDALQSSGQVTYDEEDDVYLAAVPEEDDEE